MLGKVRFKRLAGGQKGDRAANNCCWRIHYKGCPVYPHKKYYQFFLLENKGKSPRTLFTRKEVRSYAPYSSKSVGEAPQQPSEERITQWQT